MRLRSGTRAARPPRRGPRTRGACAVSRVKPVQSCVEIIALAELLPAHAMRLRGVVTSVATARAGPLNAALLSMLDAIVAREGGNDNACTTLARVAAERFAEIGWPMPQARCLELAGDRAGALAIYSRLGCAADVVVSSVRPRAGTVAC